MRGPAVFVAQALPTAISVDVARPWEIRARDLAARVGVRLASRNWAQPVLACAQMIGEGRDQRTRTRALSGSLDRSTRHHDGHTDVICNGNDGVRSARDDDNATRFPGQRERRSQRGSCRFGVDRFAIPELAIRETSATPVALP